MPVLVLAGLFIAAFVSLISTTFSPALGLFLGLIGVLLIRLLGEPQPHNPAGRRPAEGSVPRFMAARRFVFPATYLTGILAIAFVPSHETTLFSFWTDIHTLQYVRLVAAILFAGFLPGYALLGLLRSEAERPVSFLEAAAPACLLSIFLTTLTEWTLLRLGVPLERHVFGLLSIWALCALPIVLRLAQTPGRPRGAKTLSERHPEAAILVGILAVYLTAALALNFVDRFLFFDAPLNVSGGLSVLRALRPLEEDHFLQRIGANGLWYPSAFRVFLAALFQASGAPPVNAAHALDLILLKTIPILAFYQMARRYSVPERRVPILATCFFFLASGFVGLAALRSGAGSIAGLLSALVRNDSSQLLVVLDRLSTQNAFIGQFPLYTQLIHAVVPMPIALTGLFFLLTLAREPGVSHLRLGVLVFVVTVVTFLFHEIEILLMVAVIYPLLILVLPRSSRPAVLLFANLSALLFVLLLDWVGPARFFAARTEFWSGLALSGLLLLVIALRRFVPKVRGGVPAFGAGMRKVGLLAAAALLVLYMTLLVRWLRDPPLAQSWIVVPLRFYPVVFGLIGALAVGEVAYRFARGVPWSAEFVVVAASVPMFMALAKLAPGVSAQAAEYRLLVYPFIGLSVLAASATVRLASMCQRLGPSLSGFARASLVALIFVSATGGTLLAVNYWRLTAAHFPYDVLKAEVPALDYLRAYRPLHHDVATVNWLSRIGVIYSGAEHNWLADLEPLFAETDPLTALNFLDHRAIRSLYLTERDLKDLAAWGYARSFLVGHLKDYLPLPFSSPAASVYTIPPLAPAVPSSGTGLLVPSSPFLLDAIAIAGFMYTPYVGADMRQFAVTTLITDDLSEIPIPVDNPGQWERRWRTVVQRRRDGVSLTFQSPAARGIQVWASFRLDGFPGGTHRMLCMTYRTDPLPGASAYYYFELQGPRSERLYGAALRGQPGEAQRSCYPLPADLDPSWLTFALEPAGAGPLRAGLEIAGVHVTIASSPLWGDRPFNRDWQRYLTWVRNGGRLIVAGDGRGAIGTVLGLRVGTLQPVNGISGGGDRRSLPPLKVLALTTGDPTVRITASYTRGGARVAPLALVKRLGKGEVVYLALSSYFEALHAARGEPLGRELFMRLGTLLDASSLGLARRVPTKSRLYAIGRDVTLTGDIRIRSSRSPVIQGRFRAKRVTVSDPVRTSRSSPRPPGQTLSDVWIEKLETSRPSESVLLFREVRIPPQGIGNDVVADAFGAFSWTLPDPGRITIAYRNTDGKLRQLSTSGSLTFEGVRPESPILLARPEITVRGKTHFGYATVGWQGPHGGIAWRSWLTIVGDAKFTVEFSGTYLHMPDISFSGEVTSGRTNEWWTAPIRTRHLRFSQGVRPLTSIRDRF